MEHARTRKNSATQNARYKDAQLDQSNKQNFKSTKLDSRVLKQQLNMINIERKSLTRQSITEVTRELEQTRSRKRLSKAINQRDCRQSYPIRKQAILENLVNKLDSEEELRHIIERRYRNSICSTNGLGLASRNSLLVSSVTLRQQEASPEVNQYLVEKVREYQSEIERLKQQLMYSNQNVKRIEQDKMGFPNEAKRKTKDKAIQTEGSEPANKDFIMNLQKTLEVLNSSGKYALY